MDDPANPLSKRIIYFDYDRSEIRPEFQEIILAHGAYLAGHPDTVVVLEGNTDERGSREYNIALGDRRAQSVRRLLLFQGAADKQIEVVSYGEEKPVAEGHDEAAWAQNRRVELVYKR
jgi:peptidoglycan-associated lipoprotein